MDRQPLSFSSFPNPNGELYECLRFIKLLSEELHMIDDNFSDATLDIANEIETKLTRNEVIPGKTITTNHRYDVIKNRYWREDSEYEGTPIRYTFLGKDDDTMKKYPDTEMLCYSYVPSDILIGINYDLVLKKHLEMRHDEFIHWVAEKLFHEIAHAVEIHQRKRVESYQDNDSLSRKANEILYHLDPSEMSARLNEAVERIRHMSKERIDSIVSRPDYKAVLTGLTHRPKVALGIANMMDFLDRDILKIKLIEQYVMESMQACKFGNLEAMYESYQIAFECVKRGYFKGHQMRQNKLSEKLKAFDRDVPMSFNEFKSSKSERIAMPGVVLIDQIVSDYRRRVASSIYHVLNKERDK